MAHADEVQGRPYQCQELEVWHDVRPEETGVPVARHLAENARPQGDSGCLLADDPWVSHQRRRPAAEIGGAENHRESCEYIRHGRMRGVCRHCFGQPFALACTSERHAIPMSLPAVNDASFDLSGLHIAAAFAYMEDAKGEPGGLGWTYVVRFNDWRKKTHLLVLGAGERRR